MTDALDREQLRGLIRQVLRDVLPAALGAAPGEAVDPAAAHAPEPGRILPTARHPQQTDQSADGSSPRGPSSVTPSVPPTAGVALSPSVAPASPVATDGESLSGAEPVALRTDAELDAFVRRLLALFENPQRRSDLRAGRLRFRLAAAAAPGTSAPARRIDKGAVTESQVKDAARAGAMLVLGRAAVLTPLARDRARAMGVVVERER